MIATLAPFIPLGLRLIAELRDDEPIPAELPTGPLDLTDPKQAAALGLALLQFVREKQRQRDELNRQLADVHLTDQDWIDMLQRESRATVENGLAILERRRREQTQT